MHELSIAESALQLIEDAGRQQGFSRVKTIFLEIGELSCIERDSLVFCFDLVIKNSIADGARLEIINIPGSGWCKRCEKTVPLHALYDACPHCGGYQLEPTEGSEMRVKELEVE